MNKFTRRLNCFDNINLMFLDILAKTLTDKSSLIFIERMIRRSGLKINYRFFYIFTITSPRKSIKYFLFRVKGHSHDLSSSSQLKAAFVSGVIKTSDRISLLKAIHKEAAHKSVSFHFYCQIS